MMNDNSAQGEIYNKIRRISAMYRPLNGVRVLYNSISDKIDKNPEFYRVRVKGEISELSIRRHMYFTLADEDGEVSIPAVCFQRALNSLDFKPRKGDTVWVCGNVATYKAQCKVQIIADYIYYDSEGLAAMQLEALTKKLAAEGLFSRAKRPLPAFPERIGVITSSKGKVITDIIRTLQEEFPPFKLLLADSKVQGEDAPDSIAAEIAKLNFYAENKFDKSLVCDVLIVARGGGSDTDLSAYNSEKVARAVFNSKIPVISAVGHTADETLCDRVADLVCGTPTAAAKSVYALSFDELTTRLRLFEQKLYREIINILAQKHNNLLQLEMKIHRGKPENKLAAFRDELLRLNGRIAGFEDRVKLQQSKVDELEKNALAAIFNALAKRHSAVDALYAAATALNPERVLERGYALVRALQSGKPIQSIEQLQISEPLLLQFKDGSAEVTVSGIHSKRPEGRT